MTVLAVAGAGGFVGRAIVAAAEAAGVEVRPVVTPRVSRAGDEEPASSIDSWRRAEPGRWQALVDVLRGCGVLVNAAGVAAPTSNDAAELWSGNVIAPLLLAAAGAESGVRRFVHVSSAAVQGALDPLDESMRHAPTSLYAESKAEAERLLVATARRPPELVLYRPTSVQGDGRATTSLLRRVARSRLVPAVDGGGAPQPVIDVVDVGRACVRLALATTPPQVALHPWSGATTASVVEALGGRFGPIRLSRRAAERIVGASRHLLSALPAGAAGHHRRLELLLLGQSQRPTWLDADGFAPAPATTARSTVLHVVATEYGARTLLVPQLDDLRRRGYDVRLACQPDGAAIGDDLARFEPVAVRVSRRPGPVAIAGSVVRLARVLRSLHPDLVHLHSPAAALQARMVPRALWRRDAKVVYTVHGFPFQWDELDRPAARLLERVERAQSRTTDALLFQSSEDEREARRRGYRGELVHIGNGVGDEWFDVPPPDLHERPRRFVFIGRLVREKGVLDLLDAMELVDDLVLVVAGGVLESERDGVGDEVERRASGPLRGRVELTGQLDSARLRDVVAGCHACVLPSWREGLPRSLIEGFAAGRPAVVTDIRGCRELVTDGVNGFVVPRRDPAALADALARLATLPADELGRMSAAARDLARRDHRERDVFDRIAAAYATLGVRP